MYQEENGKPLIIPENCPPVKYPVVNGYTSNDMKHIGIALAAAFFIAFLSYMRNSNIFISLGIIIFISAIAISIKGRDRYAENFLDKMRIHNEYRKSVKSYIYEKEGLIYKQEEVEKNE